MRNIDPVQIKAPHIRTFVVPGFIYDAALKANLNLMDLTIYSQLRKVCSLEDIATYAQINDSTGVLHAGVTVKTLLSELALYFRLEIDESCRREAEMVLCQMAKSEEIRKIAEGYLDTPPQGYAHLYRLSSPSGVAKQVPDHSLVNRLGNPADTSGDLPYQLKTSGSNVFIIVGPGFSKYVETIGRAGQDCSFVRDFIRHCSDTFSNAEVAKHPLFATFLSSLAA